MNGKGPDTVKDYQQRINSVLEYINTHLEEKLNLKQLSSISSFSTFHFHRIIRAWLNEPLGTFVLRIRLNRAAQLLEFTENQITEICAKIGYDIPSSFDKAFKKQFGVSPQEFRKQKRTLNINYRTIINDNSIVKLKPKLINIKDKEVIFIESAGDYSGQGTGEAWKEIWNFVKEKKLYFFSIESIGMGLDDPQINENEKLRYHACLTLKHTIKPEGKVGVKTIKGGKYAVFLFKGTYSNLDVVYNQIYRVWLHESNFQLRDVPPFEKYLNNPYRTKPENLKTEIYIPID